MYQDFIYQKTNWLIFDWKMSKKFTSVSRQFHIHQLSPQIFAYPKLSHSEISKLTNLANSTESLRFDAFDSRLKSKIEVKIHFQCLSFAELPWKLTFPSLSTVHRDNPPSVNAAKSLFFNQTWWSTPSRGKCYLAEDSASTDESSALHRQFIGKFRTCLYGVESFGADYEISQLSI